MEKITDFFTKGDKFAAHAGIELLEVSEGHAKAQLPIDERHLNSVGVVHGGAIFTLADLAFAVASNSHGNVALAINVSISFVKAVRKGVLTAEAREVSLNHKLGSYTVDVKDEAGELVAVFQGMAYRKKEMLMDDNG